MTCYIIDRKANNFSRTFYFAITVAVNAYNSLRVCVLSVSTFSVPCLLHLRLLCLNELFAYLCLL